jgi:hypothetical protein
VRRIVDVGGSRGRLNQAGRGARDSSQFEQRPGTETPAGFVGSVVARLRGPRVSYNTAADVGRSFPGEGSEGYPAERNNITPRLVRRRAEPHTPFRIQHGADIDPRMPALELGLPWRPAPDSPPARPGGPGPNREG